MSSKKYNVQLTIGHNVAGVPTHTAADVCKAFTDLTGVTGFTAIPCIGMWNGQCESSTRIECVFENYEEAKKVVYSVPELCVALKQDAIMCVSEEFYCDFVFAPDNPAINDYYRYDPDKWEFIA